MTSNFGSIVAENIKFYLSFGKTSKIASKSGLKLSSYSILSHSSQIKNLRFCRYSTKLQLSLSIRWASLPGVAIIMCGISESSLLYLIISAPPMTTDILRLSPAAKTLNWSRIWNASSLVGVRTRAKIPKGSAASF